MSSKSHGVQFHPARNHGGPPVYVPNQSQDRAIAFLKRATSDRRGVGILFGPEMSGKSTVCHRFVEDFDPETAYAMIDGKGLKPADLLAQILSQFGYRIALSSVTELMNMVGVFALQQTRSGRTPLVVIENLDKMVPGALECICELAALKERHQFAMRLVLLSTRTPYSILNSMAMHAVADRLVDVFGLEAMSLPESINYLYTSLAAATNLKPESILPIETCEFLYHKSGGWPGELDRLAVGLIKNATSLPILCADSTAPESQAVPAQGIDSETTHGPMLMVTLNGQVVQELDLNASKVLLGRSERCDICMDDLAISKFHALVIRSDTGTSIVDLGSENGLYVNSEFSVDTQLRHLDVISIGSYRIKFLDSDCRARCVPKDRNFDDTIALESADEIRRVFSVGTMFKS